MDQYHIALRVIASDVQWNFLREHCKDEDSLTDRHIFRKGSPYLGAASAQVIVWLI